MTNNTINRLNIKIFSLLNYIITEQNNSINI